MKGTGHLPELGEGLRVPRALGQLHGRLQQGQIFAGQLLAAPAPLQAQGYRLPEPVRKGRQAAAVRPRPEGEGLRQRQVFLQKPEEPVCQRGRGARPSSRLDASSAKQAAASRSTASRYAGLSLPQSASARVRQSRVHLLTGP